MSPKMSSKQGHYVPKVTNKVFYKCTVFDGGELISVGSFHGQNAHQDWGLDSLYFSRKSKGILFFINEAVKHNENVLNVMKTSEK